MTESFHRLTSDTKPQIQEVQGISRRINVNQTKEAKSPIPRYTIFKVQKVKDIKKKILKEATGENLTYRETRLELYSASPEKPWKLEENRVICVMLLREKNLLT